ncbi:hypothetical protein TWF281_009774 [Arthrobotrys megalospora]
MRLTGQPTQLVGKLVTKRYHAPAVANKAIHKTREHDGAILTKVFELPGLKRTHLRQIHRILAEPGLGFFLHRNPVTRAVNFGQHYFFVSERRAFFRYRSPKNETDLRGHLPAADVGRILKMMYNPEYDEVDSDDSDYEETEEYTPQPIGPWCLKMDQIPFADELVIPEASLPVQFELRLMSLDDPPIFLLVREYLQEHVNKLSRSPTVGELVIGIGKVIARYFQDNGYSMLDEKGAFVMFRGIMNAHETTPELLPIEMSVERGCEWVEGEVREDADG